ncbi:MAG: thioredoxin fold domain-containing protein [Candidatus Lokiarchaeota archaeon]|nr:thioredoxin fold domain-containing protein [Candidatus Lokiarchaeota archaeon]MBD3198448.1 thioredoxin fold domain-containing protein [Candidatus Lokiarchaeota archaeon]
MMEENLQQGYPRILFFSSQHCMPCKPVEDKLKRINISMFGKKLRIDKINIDIQENRELIQEYKITSVPTLIIGETKLMVHIEEEDIIDAVLQAFINSVEI